jgi:hypothetical protein
LQNRIKTRPHKTGFLLRIIFFLARKEQPALLYKMRPVKKTVTESFAVRIMAQKNGTKNQL